MWLKLRFGPRLERRRIDLHARTMSGRDRDRAQVRALRRLRLELHQHVEERAQVLGELLRLERGLAARRLHDARLLDAELDAARLELLDRFGHVGRDRAAL